VTLLGSFRMLHYCCWHLFRVALLDVVAYLSIDLLLFKVSSKGIDQPHAPAEGIILSIVGAM
jgi:hypothetical protein